jgi:prephenate dehydrogenase
MRNMTSSASARGIAAIVGVGSNLGRSIARKFAHEGYTVAILARDLGGYSLLYFYLNIIKTIQEIKDY